MTKLNAYENPDEEKALQDAEKKMDEKEKEIPVFPVSRYGQDLSTKMLLLKTATVYYCYFCHGTGNALLGATLVDLQELLNCSTQLISTVFLWRNAGLVLGCLLAGRICDRINQHVLHGAALLLMCVFLSCAPLCSNFSSFCAVIVVCSVFNGFLFVGTSAFLIDLWREKCAPYLQAVFVFSMIGSSICPQIVKPFLGNPKYYHNSNTTTAAVLKNKTVAILNHSVEGEIHNTENLDMNIEGKFDTRIYFAFLICSAMFLSGTLMHALNLCYSGWTFKHIDVRPRLITHAVESKKKSPVPKDVSSMKRNRLWCLSLVALLCLIVFLFGGVEDLFGGYLITFLVRELHWPIKTASDLASLYWASQALIRLLTAVVSKWASPNILVGVFVTCAIFMIVIMTFTLTLSPIIMWIGTIGIGLSLGSLLATVITMGQTFIESSGLLSSVMLISVFSGKILTSPLMGYLFQNVSYMWFIYLALLYCSVMVLNYVLINVCRLVEKHADKSPKEKHPELDSEKKVSLMANEKNVNA